MAVRNLELTDHASFFEGGDDRGGGVFETQIGGVYDDLGFEGLFVGRRDSGKLGTFAGARLLIQTLRVALFAHFEGAFHVHFDKTVACNFACIVAVRTIGGYESGQRNDAGFGEQVRDYARKIAGDSFVEVYGAGSYRFSDFIRVGLPLNVILAGLGVFLIPRFWPL